METASKMSRRHEQTSSSEEDDLVDLLGPNYQVCNFRISTENRT